MALLPYHETDLAAEFPLGLNFMPFLVWYIMLYVVVYLRDFPFVNRFYTFSRQRQATSAL